MRRFVLAIAVCLLAQGAMAQRALEPIVETELDASEVIPGQSASLRLSVLVPSWLPDPVAFPSYEMPDLRVRLPARSTTPISRRIDGVQWSGVSRRYALSPMVPGVFTIPAQDVSVTYADPGGGDALTARVRTDPFTITGTVPEGAESLDPFIAARGLALTQEISGPATQLAPGASVTRKITARIDGASPIVIPSLLAPLAIEGMQAYPDPPRIEETADRGVLSGTRTESVTLMAQGNGRGQVPSITLDWYDIDTGRVETASVAGFEVSVTGAAERAMTSPRRGWSALVAIAAALIAAMAASYRVRPVVMRFLRARRAQRRVGKAHAERALLRAIRRRDYGACLRALDIWSARAPGPTADQKSAISVALTSIGARLYGPGSAPSARSAWGDLDRAVRRAAKRRRPRPESRLPPLNPVTGA